MRHGAHGRVRPAEIDRLIARTVAESLLALATSSRLVIPGRLRYGRAAVGEMIIATGLSQSAVFPPRRAPRHRGPVADDRNGRTVTDSLYDDHVAEVLDHTVPHIGRLRLGRSDVPARIA